MSDLQNYITENKEAGILFEASYSPEDNKLRLRSSDRYTSELYQALKAAGFNWAPKQDLIYGAWTPGREDILLLLADEVTAEGTTLAERAEAKAARLDDLSIKRAGQSNSFSQAARTISERFANGQPILIGHHSQRRAEKDKQRMESAQANAVKASQACEYWNYRAEGVERHANMKSNPRTIHNRIKKLLAELRADQRALSEAQHALKLWQRVQANTDLEKQAEHVQTLAGDYRMAPANLYSDLRNGDITTAQAMEKGIARLEYIIEGPNRRRCIAHTLNRLGYERAQLGIVARFAGDLTPVILQTFARTHGADKPKATKTDSGFLVVSTVELPAHIAGGVSVELTEHDWRELMQSAGYTVDTTARRKSTRPAKAPLINISPEEAEQLQELWNINSLRGKYGKVSERVEMSQATYSANSKGDYGRCDTIELNISGARIWARGGQDKPPAVVRVRYAQSSGMYGADRALSITDKPTKPLPFDMPALIAQARAALDKKNEEAETMRLSMLLTSCADWVNSQRSVEIGRGMIERFIELRNERLSDGDKTYILANYQSAFRPEALIS